MSHQQIELPSGCSPALLDIQMSYCLQTVCTAQISLFHCLHGLLVNFAASVVSAMMMMLAVLSRCECFDLHQQLVPYAEAYAWQKAIIKRRIGLLDRGEDHSDTLIALQHPPVYTLGSVSKEEYLHFKKEDAPFEVHKINRGGEVTYHGPGQLVMYPIINLKYHKEDVHWYFRSLEELIIRALKSAFSIKASRVEGLTGVWVGDQKVAALGIHGSRMIVYHGLALNVTTDLTPFQMIDPCGIKDRGVGSIKQILQEASHGTEIDDTLLMDMAYNSMIKEFAELFQLDLDTSLDCSFQIPAA
ncbi:hypothetical protein SETIT_3G374500v2 [Setaria italica]|uniref:lipoyl(octanoyl) transferase n=1 Tax=Setaria italica TaxID=4555 RepID=A0A368QN51_SETIT|nr:octanoyltransferase LIP2p, chloroplastic-like isoform X3 [Setaria viridis]RCV19312.1 hypothetical protein SETIT_3G374500v2 [Setaria italica]